MNTKALIKKIFNEISSGAVRADIIAMNRAVSTAVSETHKFIRTGYSIKLKDLKKVTIIKRATISKPYAEVIVLGKPIGLIKYGGARQNKKGVGVTEKKGSRRTIKGAFIATMPTGHKGIFIRKDVPNEKKPGLPIQELYGASASQLFGDERAQEVFINVYEGRFLIEYERAVKYLLNQ
jgi:hypothetical protein